MLCSTLTMFACSTACVVIGLAITIETIRNLLIESLDQSMEAKLSAAPQFIQTGPFVITLLARIVVSGSALAQHVQIANTWLLVRYWRGYC